MKENQVSRTALMAAYIRGYHCEHDVPKIFDDFKGFPLLSEVERKSFEEHYLALLNNNNPVRVAFVPDKVVSVSQIMQVMTASSLILSRARYTEDMLEEAVRQGIKQYVILGAGMDTFAFRHPEMLEHLQVFEVDHPATQAFKRQRIAELGWKHPEQLHFLPVDFAQDSLSEALIGSSYDPTALSFFSWLGVTYYLPREAVFNTLRTIADVTAVGSGVVFDYYDTDIFDSEKVHPLMRMAMQSLMRQGEPIKTAFTADTLATDLAGIGLHLYEELNPSKIEERYFTERSDQYHAFSHAHFVYAMAERERK